jgi:hypothetical protein
MHRGLRSRLFVRLVEEFPPSSNFEEVSKFSLNPLYDVLVWLGKHFDERDDRKCIPRKLDQI